MRKFLAFLVCLTLSSVAVSGGVFSDSGSAITTCQWNGSGQNVFPVAPDQNLFMLTATGTNIDLTCPTPFHPDLGSYFGSSVTGSAGGLSVQGNISFGGFNRLASFSFQSSFMDSLLPVGGAGPGTVEFTLTQTWQDFSEDGPGNDAASLLLNGTKVWSQVHPTFNAACGFACTQPQTNTIIVDEPITYGVPFSYQGSVSIQGTIGGVVFEAMNNLSISPALLTGGTLVELPEPGSLWLCGIGLLVLLRMTSNRPRR